MLKKTKSGKLAVAAGALAVALVVTGGSYAWFTASSVAEASEAKLGKMGIEGSFVADSQDYLFEPGLSIDVDGTVKNTGNLPFIAKMNLDATSKLVRQQDGALLPDGQTREIPNDPNVTVAFDADELSSKIFDDGSVYIWMKNPANEDYYLIVDPGVKADVEFLASLDGPKMGNEYMGSTISFEGEWFATQAVDGSVKDTWNVNWEDLEMVPVKEDSANNLRFRSASDPNTYLEDYVEQLFNR